jgi:hypothetical protein
MGRTTRLLAVAFCGDVPVHQVVLLRGGWPWDEGRARGQRHSGGQGSALGGVVRGEAAEQQRRHGGGSRGEKVV